jgi:hypothetical protein
MKNLCCFLRQNIVQKPSMASIRQGVHTDKIVHVDRQMHKGFIVYILNLRIIKQAIFAMLWQTTNGFRQSERQKACRKLEKKLWS